MPRALLSEMTMWPPGGGGAGGAELDATGEADVAADALDRAVERGGMVEGDEVAVGGPVSEEAHGVIGRGDGLVTTGVSPPVFSDSARPVPVCEMVPSFVSVELPVKVTPSMLPLVVREPVLATMSVPWFKLVPPE